MEPDPREPTGDLGYDLAHEATGSRPRPEGGSAPSHATDRRDDAPGDHGYDEAHDFRR